MRIRLPYLGLLTNTLWLVVFFIGFTTAQAQSASENDGITRHPLEVEALAQPRAVLDKLPALLTAALQRDDYVELSLLYLAKSNACRVIADWDCQMQAAWQASQTAIHANRPLLQIRGLISQGRGQMAIQAYSSAEKTMGEAERLLALHPSKPLAADVMLAYSSLSFSLNKAELSADYAKRGLAMLGTLPAPSVRIRLLRNQARALSQLHRQSEAMALLNGALALSDAVSDPKLSAELYIEEARIANEQGDIETQVISGRKIVEMGDRLNNAQLSGLGHEVLGQAAISTGDWRTGEDHFKKAQALFRSLELTRDERRTLRLLLNSLLARDSNITELKTQSRRLIELEKLLEIDDRKLVADSLNSQLEYAQQKFDMQKLKNNAELSKQREQIAVASQRNTYIIAFLGIILLMVLGALSVIQRQNSQKLQKAHKQLINSESRMRAIADNIPAFIAHIGTDSRVKFANAYIGKNYQRDPQSLVGMSVRELRGESTTDLLEPYIKSVLNGQRQRFEIDETIDGKTHYFQSNYVPEIGADNSVQGFYALTFDITALKDSQKQLELLSRTDSLTGVANRRHFEEALTGALARGRRDNHDCALLCLDIDHFKLINDRHGHPVGDAVIVELSKRVQSCIREVDLLARLGGDEFVILMENTAPGSAEAVCEKIIAAMKQPFTLNDKYLEVTVSAGLAYSRPTSTGEDLFRQADQALYRAKNEGRNRFSAAIA